MNNDPLNEKITRDNLNGVKKKIELGVTKSLSIKTMDNASAKAVLNKLGTLVTVGKSVGQVLFDINKVIVESFKKTGFQEREPMKAITRMFTQPGWK